MPRTALTQSVEFMDCWTDGISNQLARDVFVGLTSKQKTIPSKYFYDSRGSKLFEEICRLPEYYVTRVEMALLKDRAHRIMRYFHQGDLVELGSGANWKIRMLIDALDEKARVRTRYVPVDVSETAILESVNELVDLYPELSVMIVVADFTRDLRRLPNDGPKLMLFLGSTIGNMNTEESVSFLTSVAQCLVPGDRFLLGLDMVKPPKILEAAYDDAKGITADFNRNMLHVVNRELDANFSPDHFDHLAFFNEEEEQVEMHLKANRRMRVDISDIDLTATFEKGETILTEISRKFTRESAQSMIEQSGLEVAQWHQDPKGWFALADLCRAD
ncbi:MAG: L-histidine N(alpha)-methyltransferase [Desulfomonilaceae bacterium]|nr:L-histidine N(alpha)-methyltransferase [Desulfomonilaceae bacterium]